MPRYSIADLDISNCELLHYYYIAKEIQNVDMSWFGDLDKIFSVMLVNRDRFPGVVVSGENNPQFYLERWVKGYCDAMNCLPSRRIATPKTSCTDPAIRIIVQHTQRCSDEAAANGEYIHNLFMSAENVQGNLLEEYIAANVRPYGFLWCNGNIMRAVDFCDTSGRVFLQIKNKNNTENSSSSNIREGTTIKKWYRLGTRAEAGSKKPVFKWTDLNDIINRNKTEGFTLPPCYMNEQAYNQFLINVASWNSNIINGI